MASLLAMFGQSEREAINRAVLDSSGAVVPGARVTVTNVATNAASTALTTNSGQLYGGQLAGRAILGAPGDRGLQAGAALRDHPECSVHRAPGCDARHRDFAADCRGHRRRAAVASLRRQDKRDRHNKLVGELPLVVGGALRSPFDLAQLTPEVKNYGDQGFSIGRGQASSFGVTLYYGSPTSAVSTTHKSLVSSKS